MYSTTSILSDPVPDYAIDDVVREKFEVRRALHMNGKDDQYYDLCKIVVVDDRMVYIGSDKCLSVVQ